MQQFYQCLCFRHFDTDPMFLFEPVYSLSIFHRGSIFSFLYHFVSTYHIHDSSFLKSYNTDHPFVCDRDSIKIIELNSLCYILVKLLQCLSLMWLYNERDGASNRWRLDCLLNRLSRHRSKKTSKLRVTDISASPMDSPRKEPVTWKMFSFDDVIMIWVSTTSNE